jgi:hypothetical protein
VTRAVPSLSLCRHSGGERRRRVRSRLPSTSPFSSFGRRRVGRIACARNLCPGVLVFRLGARAPNPSCSRTGTVIGSLSPMTVPPPLFIGARPIWLLQSAARFCAGAVVV